jgi:type I restriction enzyme M protein
MEQGQLNWIANFIWGIADDVLRDLYVRGKYRDVILPMTVLRRLDALLEPTKQAVLDMKASLDKAKIVHQDQALRQAAGQAFYNTSQFTLRDLRARASQQQLKADFEAYLDGFSPNVQDILENFEFRNQIPRLSKADALGTLIGKFLSPDINLSPNPVKNGDGSIKHPGLDNHAMGTVFEELVRRFNEENNEEAGEHWTPRDAVKLMAKLIFLPIANEIESGTYLLYDGACGTGGMLTVAEETLQQLAAKHGKQVATHLYGQEINAETYANPLPGLFAAAIDGKPAVVEYEPDPDLRDAEQVPLLEDGGIEAFLRREVLPHAADAWYIPDSVKTGYEISFTRYFYKPQPLRTLEEIRADILALEKETEGLLGEIVGGGAK